MKPTRDRLYAWRKDRELTLSAAGDLVGVKHSTWSEWESGAKKPSLEKAIEVERVTDGAIAVEAWGFSAEQVTALRDFAARRASNPAA